MSQEWKLLFLLPKREIITILGKFRAKIREIKSIPELIQLEYAGKMMVFC